MEKKQAILLDKAVAILGMTLAGVVAFALAAGVVAVMLKRYVGGKRQETEIYSEAIRKGDSLAAASNEVSGSLDWLRQQLLRFASYYYAAVRSGADEALLSLVSGVGAMEKPSDIPVGKLLAAIRTGVLHAGVQLLGAGRDQFGQLLEKDQRDS